MVNILLQQIFYILTLYRIDIDMAIFFNVISIWYRNRKSDIGASLVKNFITGRKTIILDG